MANRTIEYNPVSESPVIAAKAAADIKSGVAVALTKDGVKLPAAGKIATGIAIPGDETIHEGDSLTIQIKGQGMWTAGGAFDAGDPLSRYRCRRALQKSNNRTVYFSYSVRFRYS